MVCLRHGRMYLTVREIAPAARENVPYGTGKNDSIGSDPASVSEHPPVSVSEQPPASVSEHPPASVSELKSEFPTP
jgi:hypothetical protein